MTTTYTTHCIIRPTVDLVGLYFCVFKKECFQIRPTVDLVGLYFLCVQKGMFPNTPYGWSGGLVFFVCSKRNFSKYALRLIWWACSFCVFKKECFQIRPTVDLVGLYFLCVQKGMFPNTPYGWSGGLVVFCVFKKECFQIRPTVDLVGL